MDRVQNAWGFKVYNVYVRKDFPAYPVIGKLIVLMYSVSTSDFSHVTSDEGIY